VRKNFVKFILNAVLSYVLKAKDFYILNGKGFKTQELFRLARKLSIILVKIRFFGRILNKKTD